MQELEKCGACKVNGAAYQRTVYTAAEEAAVLYKRAVLLLLLLTGHRCMSA